MCTAAQNHCPSCCTNHGGVYSRPCPVVYQLRPGQLGFVHIYHLIDEQNPDLRALQAQGAEVLMVKGQVGQSLSAVLDQGLRA